MLIICIVRYIYSFIFLFVLSIQGLSGTLGIFSSGLWDLFVLGTRSLYKLGVMIRWLGHRDALWVPVYRAMLGGVRCGRVRGAMLGKTLLRE